MAMSARDALFLNDYLVSRHPEKAALAAGFAASTARTKAYQWVSDRKHKPDLFDAIAAADAKVAAKLDVTLERIKREVAKVAFAEMGDVTSWGTKEVAIGFDDDGKRLMPEDIGQAVVVRYVEAPYVTPFNSEDLPEHVRGAVAEVGLGREGFKIKMHPKLQALDMLTKMVGGYAPEEHVLRGPDGRPIQADVTITPADAYRALKEAG